jgi:hypothetical protein
MKNLVDAIHSLVPDAQFHGYGSDYSKWTWTDSRSQPTAVAVSAELKRLQAAEPIRLLREKRTQLLAETDWVVIRARENGGQVPAAWKTYRVALRDLPSGLDTVEKVNAVTWPTKPS